MLPDKKYEDMERYINLEMTDEERTSFELEIASSETLARAVALYKDIPNQLQNITADLDFNQKLQNARANFNTPTTKQSSKTIWWMVGVIMIAGLAYFSYRMFNVSNNTETPTQEQEELILPEGVPIASLWDNTDKPTSLITRSGETLGEAEQKYEKAFEAYDKKDYQAAIDILVEIPLRTNITDKALLLKGVSEYELRNYAEAISTYENYLNIEMYPKDMALWYQALAYLQNDQNEAAKENLQIIINEDFSKAKEAKILMERLD